MRKGHEENADLVENKVNSLKEVNSYWNIWNCYNFVLDQLNLLSSRRVQSNHIIGQLNSFPENHFQYIQVDSNYTPWGLIWALLQVHWLHTRIIIQHNWYMRSG